MKRRFTTVGDINELCNVHITISAGVGCGKSLVATKIHEALTALGVKVLWDEYDDESRGEHPFDLSKMVVQINEVVATGAWPLHMRFMEKLTAALPQNDDFSLHLMASAMVSVVLPHVDTRTYAEFPVKQFKPFETAEEAQAFMIRLTPSRAFSLSEQDSLVMQYQLSYLDFLYSEIATDIAAEEIRNLVGPDVDVSMETIAYQLSIMGLTAAPRDGSWEPFLVEWEEIISDYHRIQELKRGK